MSNFQSYQAYTPTNEEVFTSGTNIREESPVHRVGMSNGVLTEASERATDRGREAQLNPAYGADSWQATAMTTTGRVPSEITGETLVTIGGIQGRVDFFVKEGILQRGADGSYTEGSGPEIVPPEILGDILPMDDGSMAVVNAALGPLPQHALGRFTAQSIAVASGRLDVSSLVAKFSQDSGLDPAQSQERISTVQAIYQDQADRAIESRAGINAADSSAFWEWARTNHVGQLQDAIGKQLRSADVSGYTALAQKWLASTPPTLQALQAGGVPTRNRGQGVECYVRGTWMSPAAAARAGLI